MWTISTCSFGWRSKTPEPSIRAPLTVESKGRPTAPLRRYCMSTSCPTDSIGGWMCTTMPFAAATPHSHSAEEGALRTVAVARRHGNRLGAALADHLLDDRPTALFERVRVGHQRELAEIAIPDLQVFVVQESNLKQI